MKAKLKINNGNNTYRIRRPKYIMNKKKNKKMNKKKRMKHINTIKEIKVKKKIN